MTSGDPPRWPDSIFRPVARSVTVASSAGAEPPITVAVVSWNTRELLDSCLRSLRPDVDAGHASVWVVDNGSADGSPEMVRSRHPWATLVTPGENLGFGNAVNLVAERTRGPWLVAANADVELEPGALERLRLTAATPAATPAAIGMVGPRLLLLDGSTQISVRPFPGVRTAVLLALHADRVSSRAARALRTPAGWEPPTTAPVPWIAGALVLMSRAAFTAAGGFDPDTWLYGEDLDLCWRMRRAGWQIVYEPGARVHHAHSAASAQRFQSDSLVTHIDAVNYLWMLRRRGAIATRVAATIGALDALARIPALNLAARRDRERFGLRAKGARAALTQHLLGLRSERELERRVARARGPD
jgi:N-acetylglucosaminyl-diphospho-decaprenol L-rhamnosyltransferase